MSNTSNKKPTARFKSRVEALALSNMIQVKKVMSPCTYMYRMYPSPKRKVIYRYTTNCPTVDPPSRRSKRPKVFVSVSWSQSSNSTTNSKRKVTLEDSVVMITIEKVVQPAEVVMKVVTIAIVAMIVTNLVISTPMATVMAVTVMAIRATAVNNRQA